MGGLIESGEFFLVIFMVLTTLITLYYYFRVVFVIFMHVNETPKVEKILVFEKKYSIVGGVWLVGINATGLLGCLIM